MGSFSPHPGLAGALRGPRAHSTHTPHPHTPRGSRMPTPEPCTPRSAPTAVLGRGGNGEGPTGDRVTTLPFWGRGAGSVVPPPSSSGAEPFPGEEAASPSCAQFNRVNFVVCCSYPLPGQATTANAPPNPSTCSPGPRGGGGAGSPSWGAQGWWDNLGHPRVGVPPLWGSARACAQARGAAMAAPLALQPWALSLALCVSPPFPVTARPRGHREWLCVVVCVPPLSCTAALGGGLSSPSG